MAPVSCAHARKTIPMAPIHPFTKKMVRTFIVSRIVDPKLVQIIIVLPVFHMHLIKCFFPSITFLRTHCFFSSTFFHFHCTLSRGLAGAYVNPRSFFQTLFVHSLLCQTTHSLIFLMDFSQTCVSTSPMYALSVILFSA